MALSPEASRWSSSAEHPRGRVTGVILDANDARVVDATVRIESGKIKRKIKSDQAGKFEIWLPAGSYRMTVEANGFRRFVSSPLVVKPHETEKINIHLEVAVPPGLVPAFSTGGSAEGFQ